MKIRYGIELLVLILAFITGVVIKKRTKYIVKELDGFSLVHQKSDCRGTLIASISETENKRRKMRGNGSLMYLIVLTAIGFLIIGMGVYVQAMEPQTTALQAAAQEVEPAYLKIQGKVEVKGDSWNGSLKDFSFVVSGDGYPETKAIPDKDGNIFFGSYTYLKEGTHMLTVRQNKGSLDGINYDSQEIQVTVEAVRRNKVVELNVSYKKDGANINGISFVNTYTKPVEEKKTEAPALQEAAGEGKLVIYKSEGEIVDSDISAVDGEDLTSEGEAAEDTIEDTGAEAEKIRRCTYTITLKNEGESTLYGIYVRDYMTEYTSYESHMLTGAYEGDGVYGAIGGKEHVTLFLEELEAGESVEIQIYCWMKVCVPEGYIPESLTCYEVTGEPHRIYTNDPDDPAYIYRDDN